MANKTLNTKILLRADLATNWQQANPVLMKAEPAYETDTGVLKLGDGTTAYKDLKAVKVGQLSAVRNFEISGGATAQAVSFDGSADVNLVVTAVDATKLTGVVPDINIKPELTAVVGYFNEGGVAKNAAQLDGHGADYFATAQQLTSALNGLAWRPVVNDVTALKALQAPREGWTVSINTTNAIYRFDDDNKATADEGEDIIIPDDKTSGAWVRIGTTIYSAATNKTDGLMSAADKAKLDGIAAEANKYELPVAKADTLGGVKVGTGLSVTTDGTLTNAGASVWVVKKDILSQGTFVDAEIGNPVDGVSPKVGDTVFDSKGDSYVVTAAALSEGDSPVMTYTVGAVINSPTSGFLTETAAAEKYLAKTDAAGTAVGGNLEGTVGNATIKDGVVATAKIADNAVVTAKIADGAITPAKLSIPEGDVLIIDGGTAAN